MVDVHGADMTSRDMKDARRIQAAFEFEEIGSNGRRVTSANGRRGEREPPPDSSAGISRRRQAFANSLTTDHRDAPSSNPTYIATSSPALDDPTVLE